MDWKILLNFYLNNSIFTTALGIQLTTPMFEQPLLFLFLPVEGIKKNSSVCKWPY